MQTEQDRQTCTTPQENFKKNMGQAWKITNFDRQAALFDGDSMEAITYRFSEVRQVGWHRRRDVQLISQEIDAASRLFCFHSADLVKSYL